MSTTTIKTSNITNGSVTAAKLSSTAVTDKLGFTPFNAANFASSFTTELAGKSTTDLQEGSNLYYTTTRFDTRLNSKSTDNLAEGTTNLYYTTTRFDTRFDTRLALKSTTDLAEGTNLYYTTTRWDTRLAAKTTDNLTEGSTNLYYTSARANTDFDTRLATKSTTNLAEGTNLYYTDSRARLSLSSGTGINYTNSTGVIAIDSTVATLTGTQTLTNKTLTTPAVDRIDWAAAGTGAPAFTTRSDGTKLLLYPALTGSQVDYAVGINSATLWSSVPVNSSSFYFKWYGGTTEVASLDGAGNLTVAGSMTSNGSAVVTLTGTQTITNKTITSPSVDGSATQFTNTTEATSKTVAPVTFAGGVGIDKKLFVGGDLATGGNLTIDGNFTVGGTTVTLNATNLAVEDNMIYLNNGSTVTDPDLGFAGNYNDGTYRHAGLFRDATDGYWKVFKNYTLEPDASPYIDTAHASFALADMQAANFRGALVGNADTATKLAATKTINGTAFDGSANISFGTDSVSEGSTNLYYTTTRVNSAFDTRLALKSTTDLAEGTNLYYTTARWDTRLATKTTDNLTEGSTNLYYTTARWDTRLATKSTTDLAEGTNLYYTTARWDTRLATKTTDNLTEGSTNLYFTNARVGTYLTTNNYATQAYAIQQANDAAVAMAIALG